MRGSFAKCMVTVAALVLVGSVAFAQKPAPDQRVRKAVNSSPGPGAAEPVPATQFSVGGTGNVSAAAVTANSFTGDGSALINLNPASIAAGTAGINVTGTANNVTGIVQIGKGGTGATNAAQALINLGAAEVGHTHSGTPYDHVIVVALSGGNFTSIQAALASITDNDADNRYLIWVAPGTYAEQVTMKEYVDIEGASELATRITNTGGSNENLGSTVRGANNAELRFITVENTGGAAYAVAIFNSSRSVRLTHVVAAASGGTTTNAGVCNFVGSNSVMTFVSATGTGGQYAYGVENSASSPTMTNVNAAGKEGSDINYGVMNMLASAPVMYAVNAEGSGGNLSYGVKNESGSDANMSEVIAKASGSTTANYGVYNHSSSPTIRNSVVTALTGPGTVAGIFNYSANGTGSKVVTIDNCRVAGSQYGVYSTAEGVTGTSLTVKIVHSWIIGPTNSIWSGSPAFTQVGTSQLLGGAVDDNGAGAPLVTCYACYDENFTNTGIAVCP